MKYTTLIQVPSTKNGILVKNLARLEPSLARATGYNTKIVENSGVQLSRLFDKVFRPTRCHSDECMVRRLTPDGKGSRCRITNVVYKAECVECEKKCDIKNGSRSVNNKEKRKETYRLKI